MSKIRFGTLWLVKLLHRSFRDVLAFIRGPLVRPTRPKLAILAQNNFDTAADFVFVSVFIVLNVHSFFNLFPYSGIRKMKQLYWIHTASMANIIIAQQKVHISTAFTSQYST